MATKFTTGEQVYVPATSLTSPSAHPYALVPRTVLGQTGRKILVDDAPPAGHTTGVASSKVHGTQLGFLVLRVGDFVTEPTLIDPLGKSVLQFLRLLLSDDHVRSYSIRTTGELETLWAADHNLFSHVVVIGHGSPAGLGFIGQTVTGAGLADLLISSAGPSLTPKTFVSLACATGRQAFAGGFSSEEACCRLFVAPFHQVHGAAASNFFQSFLAALLLEGKPAQTAFRASSRGIVSGSHFRLWKQGSLVAGKAK